MTEKNPADPLAQFAATFFEECAELLSDLENRLTSLDAAHIDSEDMNAIFRAIHSIKAGAGAFKFVELVEFSHAFENLLDLLRAGEAEVTDEVCQLLIKAADIVADLVDAAQDNRAVEDGFGSDTLEQIQNQIDVIKGVSGADDGPAADTQDAGPSAPQDTGTMIYTIVFRPHADLFRHANEPLLLVRELRRLGDVVAKPDCAKLPPLQSLDPEQAYIGWTFVLTSDQPLQAIEEVFEFVVDDCDLDITATPGSEDAPSRNNDEPSVTAAAKDDKAQKAKQPSAQAGDGGSGKRSKVNSIRVDLDRIDRLVNMVGELVITQAMLRQQVLDNTGEGAGVPMQGLEDLALHTRELQEGVMAIRMQPVKSVFSRMPRIVRDLSSKLGKKVVLETSGEETEIDKTVIEELGDPLTHMIRNSLDHGLESPEERQAAGKPAEGRIKLSAEHRGGRILIQIEDDGRGIDREKVLAKAVERGIVAADAHPADEEIDNLIFEAGFSTADEVTDVSGRGVGMDVVRRNIANLGGRVSVDSVPGKGSRFSLTLPLTLAVLDGMIVAVGAEKYVLPLTSIVETLRPEPNDIHTLVNQSEVVSIRGDYIRMVYLHRQFDVPDAITDPSSGLVVLVETENGSRIGVFVDELLGQQQVVIKSLEANYDPVDGISGATILGNGRVALILDLDALESASLGPCRTNGGLGTQATSPPVRAASGSELTPPTDATALAIGRPPVPTSDNANPEPQSWN